MHCAPLAMDDAKISRGRLILVCGLVGTVGSEKPCSPGLAEAIRFYDKCDKYQ